MGACAKFVALVAIALGCISAFQLRELPWDPADQTDKVFVITGGSAGLGAETALMLAELGAAKIVLGCRNATKAASVVDGIHEKTGRAGVVESWDLDLARLDSVRAFAARVRSELGSVDVLINNAGLVPSESTWNRPTADGYEMSFQVNYLAHVLLTRLLIADLHAVVHVSSGAHMFATGDDALLRLAASGEGTDVAMVQYGRTKLLTQLFSRELARREPRVKTFSTHPGTVKTEIARAHHPAVQWANDKLGDYFLRGVREGAKTTLAPVVSKTPHESGRYYCDASPEPAYEHMPDNADELAAAQWEEVTKMLGL